VSVCKECRDDKSVSNSSYIINRKVVSVRVSFRAVRKEGSKEGISVKEILYFDFRREPFMS